MKYLMKRIILFFTLAAFIGLNVHAQQEATTYEHSVATNSFWDNWFVQAGVDMILVNAYGENFKRTFPNGKAFGINVGAGKWFTPEFGFRGGLQWDNGIINNKDAVWLRDGRTNGMIMLSCDVLLNVLNLFGEYNAERKYNLNVFPRMGALATLDRFVGSPVLGLGVNNTYRVSNKLRLYADLSYQFTSSVIGVQTDDGTGNNGFFSLDVGVQIDLGRQDFQKASARPLSYQHAVATNSFWSNWFVQAGLGMSLLNAYGRRFTDVFPNGKTLGVNVGVGKWFTPQMGFRGGLNWQNGIVGNHHLGWMDPDDDPGGNHKSGGYGAAYLDVFFNLHHLFGEYDENRFWNAIVFPRAGLDSNFQEHSCSPLVGVGTEQTFRLSDGMKLFVDVAYQFTSSEFMKKTITSHHDGNSNGWFDLNVGVQFELGKSKGKFVKLTE